MFYVILNMLQISDSHQSKMNVSMFGKGTNGCGSEPMDKQELDQVLEDSVLVQSCRLI